MLPAALVKLPLMLPAALLLHKLSQLPQVFQPAVLRAQVTSTRLQRPILMLNQRRTWLLTPLRTPEPIHPQHLTNERLACESICLPLRLLLPLSSRWLRTSGFFLPAGVMIPCLLVMSV